jgi:hypothetical protein
MVRRIGELQSPIFVTVMMEALSSFEAQVPIRATRRNIQEDDILHSHRRENLKSYTALTDWAPVKYELRFYIPEDGILHSHSHENLYAALLNKP